MKRAPLGLVAILSAAAAFYALLWPRYPVGHYNDDALYILGAESLLRGEYVLLQRPARPALNDPLPGFSLLLTPFVAVVRPHWDWLKVVPWATTLLCGLLIWVLSRSWLPTPMRLLLAGLFAFNPGTVSASGVVMSEPCFLAMALAAFIGLGRVLRGQDTWSPWWVGALIGWAALVRPQGILLVPAAALGLAHARRWRAMAPVLGTALGIWAAVLLRNHLLTRLPTGYMHYWNAMLPFLSGDQGLLIHSGFGALRGLWVETVFAWPFPEAAWPGMQPLLTGAGALLTLAGLPSLSREGSRDSRALLSAMTGFVTLYLVLHALWMAVSPRYFLPLLPFVLAAVLAGARQVGARLPRPWIWAACALVPLILCYAYQDVFAARQAFSPPAENRLPWAALRWIERETPASADILSARAPVIYLYTRRHARSFVGARGPEEFRYLLLKEGLTHVLCEPKLSLLVHTPDAQDPVRIWQRLRAWIQAWPQAFPLAFHDAEGSAWLHRVAPEPGFVPAYEAYQSALQDLDQAAWPRGLTKLRRALSLYPAFPSALNARGSAYLLSGGSLAKAEAQFQEALRLRPDHPQALLNLARVSKRRGRAAAARDYLRRCRQAVVRSGDGGHLLPAIEAEEAGL